MNALVVERLVRVIGRAELLDDGVDLDGVDARITRDPVQRPRHVVARAGADDQDALELRPRRRAVRLPEIALEEIRQSVGRLRWGIEGLHHLLADEVGVDELVLG